MINNILTEKYLKEYGREHQLIVCMEECSELIKEISKTLRNKGDKDNLTEEIADVLICINTLKVSEGITDKEIQKAVKQKEDRNRKRLAIKKIRLAEYGCIGCEYYDMEDNLYPCVKCRHNYYEDKGFRSYFSPKE